MGRSSSFPTLLFVSFLVFLLYISNVESIGNRGYPLVWTESSTISLKKHDVIETVFVKYLYPCNLLPIDKFSETERSEFSKWCMNLFETKLIVPLIDFCHISTKSNHENHGTKPLNSAGSVFGTILGISGKSFKSDQKQRKELYSLLNEFEEKVEMNNSGSDDVLVKLYKAFGNLISPESIEEMKTEFNETVTDINELRSKLVGFTDQSVSILNQIREEWTGNKFSLRIYDLFSINLHDTGVVEKYSKAKPEGCYINEREGMIFIRVLIPETDTKMKVYQANSFTFYELEDEHKHLGYKLDYIGPKSVAYDESINCVVPFSNEQGSVLYFPTPEDCIVHNDLSIYKYWKKSCQPVYYIDENSIQLKQIGNKLLVYCSGFNITLYKAVQPCPNFVFEIHYNEPFSFDLFRGDKLLHRSDFSSASELLSNKINFHLMPKLLNVTMNDFPIAVPCPTQESSLGIVVGMSVLGVILLVVLIAIVLIVIYLYKKSKEENYEGRGQNVIKLVRRFSSNNNGIKRRDKIRAEIPMRAFQRESLKFIPEGIVADNTDLFEDLNSFDVKQ